MPTSPRERRNSSYIGFGRRATPAQKTLVVQKLRQKYSLNLLLSIAQLPRATFYYHLKQMQKEDKYASVKEEITTIYHENRGRYGYRRITTELRKRKFSLNHKTVQRLMKELGLVCRVKMKKYRSYKGEVGKIAPNLLNRDFRAEKPNQKWVTDVTEFSLFGEKLYLSTILDLHSSDLVSYTISDRPVLSMVTTMLDEAFAKIPAIYIADGHHRCASAVKVGLKRREQHPDYTGEEEFNYFLSVIFPDEELQILDYNRVVKDLNGLDVDAFLAAIEDHFMIEKKGRIPYRPEKKGAFGMFLEDEWYCLTAKKEIRSEDAVEGLDVSLLQNYLLNPVLGIEDPKTDKRIDFVGGIRGLAELERRVHTDMKVAFSMYPTSIGELFAVADAGRLMPPKSTWFEPKLRSGLFLHEIER